MLFFMLSAGFFIYLFIALGMGVTPLFSLVVVGVLDAVRFGGPSDQQGLLLPSAEVVIFSIGMLSLPFFLTLLFKKK